MRYLGIDPGTTRIGYGVIEDAAAGPRPLAWGIIDNPGADSSADKLSTAQRLTNLIDLWRPDVAAVEKLFFINNKRSAMSVSEMRGVIMLTLSQRSVPVIEYTPLQVKQRICGHGGAQKRQVQNMIRLLLHIREHIEPDDAADALALALCCSTERKAS